MIKEEDKDLRDFETPLHNYKKEEDEEFPIDENPGSKEEIGSNKITENSNLNDSQPDPEEDKEKDRKSMKYLLISLGIIIGLLIVFFSTRFLFNPAGEPVTLEELHGKNLAGELDKDKAYTYNGYSFVFYDNLWYTQLKRGNNLYNIPLHFSPKDLESLAIAGNGVLNQSQIYITFDPREGNMQYMALAAAELSMNLAKGINVVPLAACIVNETDACIDRPIVTCSDSDKNVIFIREANKTAVVFKDNCVIIQGKEMELIRAIDKFLLYWYGIMKN